MRKIRERNGVKYDGISIQNSLRSILVDQQTTLPQNKILFLSAIRILRGG